MTQLLQESFGRYVWAWLFVWTLAILILVAPGPFELWEKLGWGV